MKNDPRIMLQEWLLYKIYKIYKKGMNYKYEFDLTEREDDKIRERTKN